MSELRERSDPGTAQFFAAIEASGALPAGVSAAEAARAVLCPLWLRVTRGMVRQVLAALPPGLRALLEDCAARRDEAPAVFDAEQFMRMVRYRLPDLSFEQADDLVRAVFGALQALLPAREQRDLMSQLPRDLRALWPPAPPRRRVA